jgi:hypothetical protein
MLGSLVRSISAIMAGHYSGRVVDDEALEETLQAESSWAFRLAPSQLTWFLVLGALFWAGGLFGLAVPFLYRIPYHFVVGAGMAALLMPAGWYAIRVWRGRHDVIVADETGIARARPDGRRTFIPWGDLVRVREREFFHRLELVGTLDRTIPIEYLVEDFEALVLIIQRQAPQLRDRHVALREFHRHAGPLVGIALIGVATLLVEQWLFYYWAIGAALVGAGLARQIWRLGVGIREVELRSFVRSRRIPYARIEKIVLTRTRESHHPVFAVFLYLAGGETVGLATFREGVWALFDSLAEAWEQGRHLPG